MQEMELCRDLRARLADVTQHLQLEADSNLIEYKAPRIVDGFLPPARSRGPKEEEPEFPFIIVRPSAGQTNASRATTATVKIMVGCYDEDYDGHQYALLVLAAIRRGLMEQPTVGSVFRLEMPFEWELPDDQPWPQWQLEITTRWTIATPLTTEPVDNVYDENDGL